MRIQESLGLREDFLTWQHLIGVLALRRTFYLRKCGLFNSRWMQEPDNLINIINLSNRDITLSPLTLSTFPEMSADVRSHDSAFSYTFRSECDEDHGLVPRIIRWIRFKHFWVYQPPIVWTDLYFGCVVNRSFPVQLISKNRCLLRGCQGW